MPFPNIIPASHFTESPRDNEYGSRTYEVPAFAAAKYKTTNGEFWEFVCDGGYSNPELWSDAGM